MSETRLQKLSKVDPRLKGAHLLKGKGNIYIFEAQKVMIDTGAQKDLESLEILPPVEFLLLTHLHPCHAGGIEKVFKAYYPKVFCSEVAVETLVKDHGITAEKIEPLKGNESFTLNGLQLRAIACPGHSNDSMAFYETSLSLLATGDTVLEEEGHTPQGAHLEEWAESVRFLSTLQVSALLPGHGAVQKRGIVKTIVESYAYLQGMAEKDPIMGDIAGGIQFADLGMMNEALRAFDRVLEKEPENPGAAFSKGLTLLKMSRFHEAVSCFDLALKVVPDFKEAANAKELAQSAAKGMVPGKEGR